MDRGPRGPHESCATFDGAFVAFVDAIDKSHRTTHRGDKGPSGMDRGPRGPHESCATFRKQRVDMQGMWRQGSLRHPVLTLLGLLRLLTARVIASD